MEIMVTPPVFGERLSFQSLFTFMNSPVLTPGDPAYTRQLRCEGFRDLPRVHGMYVSDRVIEQESEPGLLTPTRARSSLRAFSGS